jgi:hypothetical protein
MALTIVNKHSTHTLAISRVCWSCLGGVGQGRGIQELKTNDKQFAWIDSFMIGLVFLSLSIFWSPCGTERSILSSATGALQ